MVRQGHSCGLNGDQQSYNISQKGPEYPQDELKWAPGPRWRPQVRLLRAVKVYRDIQGPDRDLTRYIQQVSEKNK